jgi:hypothetical protein
LLIPSALRRTELYVDAYGLTRLRISVAGAELWRLRHRTDHGGRRPAHENTTKIDLAYPRNLSADAAKY